MSDTASRFPEPVELALLQPSGDLTVGYTPPAELRAGPPPRLTPLLATRPVHGRLVAVLLAPDGRFRFIRTGVGTPPREAHVHAPDVLRHPRWLLHVLWDNQTLAIAVSAASRPSISRPRGTRFDPSSAAGANQPGPFPPPAGHRASRARCRYTPAVNVAYDLATSVRRTAMSTRVRSLM